MSGVLGRPGRRLRVRGGEGSFPGFSRGSWGVSGGSSGVSPEEGVSAAGSLRTKGGGLRFAGLGVRVFLSLVAREIPRL